MAGGGIVTTPLDVARIRCALNYPDRLDAWLTTLDEDGWRAAQELLAHYARRDEQHNQTEGGNP